MYTLIEHRKLTSTASSITFSNIPQIFSDLYLVLSLRNQRSTAGAEQRVYFNGDSNFSTRYLANEASSTATGAITGRGFSGSENGATTTSNTFSNSCMYIPNYTSNSPKSFSADSVHENNSSTSYVYLVSGVWNGTSPITSLAIESGYTYEPGCSATLYGINRTTALGRPKAIGGNITYSNGYWVHTFTGSGTFIAQQALDVEALVVAGGGGGGHDGNGSAGGG